MFEHKLVKMRNTFTRDLIISVFLSKVLLFALLRWKFMVVRVFREYSQSLKMIRGAVDVWNFCRFFFVKYFLAATHDLPFTHNSQEISRFNDNKGKYCESLTS